MARNKKVVCEICCRVMRRDHLERHMQQHENGKFEEGESFHGSAFSASTTSLESGFSSVSTTRSVSINEEVVLKTMNMHAEEYERKLQLGEINMQKRMGYQKKVFLKNTRRQKICM